MIIAAVVLQLQAQNAGRLPVSHGRLLHAAFLNTIRSLDAELSAQLHNAVNKSFSLGHLQLQQSAQKMTFQLQAGTQAKWRICLMGDSAKAVLQLLQAGLRFQVGSVAFVVKEVYRTQSEHAQAGLTTTEYLEDQCAQMPPMERLTLEFLSPTTFRCDEHDYPWPKPELVFGSLAERWNKISGKEHFDVEKVKKIAADYLLPERWQGSSKRVNVSPQHGVTGFVGSFTYKLTLLPPEFRAMFISLGEFAVFAGVGRLTGQGLGQVKIKYE